MATVVELFLVFARAGLLAWGGGPSMIPLIRAEVVGHGWLTDAEFVEALAMGNALPGPIATKMSGYVGYKIAGWPGAVAATSGMAFPTVVLMLALASFYFRFREARWMQSMMSGLRPAAVALLLATVVQVWPESMAGVRSIVLMAGVLLAVLAFNVHPAIAIVAAGLAGLLLYR
jgi:chromate transporter